MSRITLAELQQTIDDRDAEIARLSETHPRLFLDDGRFWMGFGVWPAIAVALIALYLAYCGVWTLINDASRHEQSSMYYATPQLFCWPAAGDVQCSVDRRDAEQHWSIPTKP